MSYADRPTAELFDLLLDNDEDVTRAAYSTLSDRNYDGLLNDLRSALVSSEPTRRSLAVSVIGQAGSRLPDEERAACVELVKRFLHDPYAAVVVGAVAGLDWLDTPAAREAILTVGDHASDEVRALVALALDPNVPGATALLLTLMRDPDKEVRRSAAACLTVWPNADSPDILSALRMLLRDFSAEVREEAAKALQVRGESLR
jgi:HEAT repeat protein